MQVTRDSKVSTNFKEINLIFLIHFVRVWTARVDIYKSCLLD